MEEEDVNEVKSERIKQLGFKPQKEIIYNRLLPYADQLDDESRKMFTEIKANLGKAVMLREMRPACGMWSARLVRYTKLYGLKFSKEDHIVLVNLIYEVLTIPNLEPYLVNKFAQTLMILLKKKHLLSPDEIVLEWRPLYELCKRIMDSSHAQLGMYRYFSSLEHTLDALVHAARFYFPVTATQEILDEFKPQLSPLTSPPETMELLEWFLPVALPPEKSHLGYKLWFTDIMELWATCNNAPAWETEVMWLMANVAGNNIGYIDWEPYIPIMFTRFLRSFNLPVIYKQYQAPKHHKIETSAISIWIVSVLGGGSSCQKYLDKFLKTIESYFHPANFGVWLLKLKELLRKLPQYFIQRLHSERYHKLTWETPIPDSHKLTEEDIDRFVESIRGVAMQAMFSKLGCSDVSVALQHLATLRPKMIIPMLIERMYSTLDSVTEPHKLTSVMQCVVAVARPMVQGARSGYPEGPTHVIPLLMSTLPGIDPNDFRKCFVTFQFISIFVTLIPIVDSSKASEYWNDLTEEEEVICAATANFEDFVAQFFDRVLNFVESSSLETTRMEKDMEKRSKIENLAEGALTSVCFSVLSQCSSEIFKIALKKLHTFATERILETKVAGHFIASLCRVFARVNPEETLKVLVPHLCSTILTLTESEDVQKEEILGDELLYNLLILSEVVDGLSGLLPYVPQIVQVLDRTLHLTCREGYSIAAKLLNHLLLSLTWVRPLELRSLNHSYDKHVKNYLPIRDWGKPGNIYNLNLKWHVPNEDEIKCVQEIVSKYLPAELMKIRKHINDEKPLTREELLRSLNIILGVLGARFVLPLWEEEPLTLLNSALKTTPFQITLGVNGKVNMPDGSNIRYVLAHTMDQLQKKIFQCAEDDTRSLFAMIQIYELLLLNQLRGANNFESRWKHYQMVKKVLENRLVGKKRHMRALLIERTVLQHESRSEKALAFLTNTHKMIMLNLLELSCSHYSEVRTKAQTVLHQGLNYFSYSYTVLIPQLVQNLQMDTLEHHERFKGSLYVLLGPKQTPVVTRHDWEMLLKMWPAIVKAKPSEKLSVVKLLDSIVKNVHKHFPTITISLNIPDSCVEKAKLLWKSEPLPDVPTATDSEIEEGKRMLVERNKHNLDLYLSLLDSLMDAIEQNNLHWRYHSTALCFIRDLVHPDLPYPARIVKTFLYTLINDSLELRKIAIRSTVHLLKQQKRPHKKIVVNVESLTNEPLPEKLTPGIRSDNMWLQYNAESRPVSAEEWEKPRYLHKPTIGYFQWPRELKLYAPSDEQPPLDRNESELKPEEKEVYNFFINPDNVAKLIKYFSLEEKKGKDKFNGFKFLMFKGLFRNHGDTFLDVFKPHLERLVVDKHESSQRCAAEIIAGIIRGSKHWPFDKVFSLWQFLGPLIRTALANMTEETVPDWGICFATASENRDPNRNHWLLEVLMEDPLRDGSSYLGCGRLYALQGALNQQEWRVAELYTRLLEYFRPFLNHSFQNVRERVASVLTNIFQPDIKIPGGKTLGPHVKDFMAEIVAQLDVLYSLTFTKDSQRKKDETTNHVVVNEIVNKLDTVQISDKGDGLINGLDQSIEKRISSEKEVALRLFKTICKWITGSLSRSQCGALPEFYTVFPLICLLESYDQDEELGKLCSMTLAALAQCTTAPQNIPVVFSSIKKVAQSGSWWARSSVVDFLQVFTFHNMSLVLSNPVWVDETTDIVLKMLEDERLEVREKAAEVLGGLLHCDFITDTEKLLVDFKKKANVKIKKNDPKLVENIRIRHCGILGLCAFINSSPYDVPDCVPEIFFVLGNHLNDPQPIPSTIRKTLNDFKRTHHDSWEIHQLKFTERQLEVLNDLIVPPSYYA